MRIKLFHLSIYALIIGLLGCQAMLVPKTDDPYEKLTWAEELYDNQRRPLPAEQLIQEAITIFQEENDEIGLAHAYRHYGFFFHSPSIQKWEKHYRESGFLDKTATYDKRYKKAVDYFKKSENLFIKHEKFDAATNVQFNLSLAYLQINNKKGGCEYLQKSIDSYRKNLEKNPGVSPITPEGYANYEEYITDFMERRGC